MMSKRPKISKATGREVLEWIGKNANSVPPNYVKLRVFDRYGGICHISGRKIQVGEAWDTEHVVALADGGANRESNLRPALKKPHLDKTAAENKARAKTKKKRERHVGLKKQGGRKIKSRGFDRVEKEPEIGKAKIEKFSALGLPEIARRYQPK